jgi:hypothetical protein
MTSGSDVVSITRTVSSILSIFSSGNYSEPYHCGLWYTCVHPGSGPSLASHVTPQREIPFSIVMTIENMLHLYFGEKTICGDKFLSLKDIKCCQVFHLKFGHKEGCLLGLHSKKLAPCVEGCNHAQMMVQNCEKHVLWLFW